LAFTARPQVAWLRKLGGVLLFAAMGLVAAVVALERYVIFPRWAIAKPPDPGQVPGIERLFIDTDDGKVEAWLMLGDGVSSASPGPLVVFAHGNGELIDHWREALAPYRKLGVSVLLPEFRGYGRSAGSPSEQAIVGDFARFVELVAARPEVDATRLVYHGRSLGGGVVAQLASRRRPRALVLQSTFTSVAVLARSYLVPRSLVLDPFESEAALRELDVPALIMHGRRDRVVPSSHAEALARALRGSRLVWYDADHNDCPPEWDAWFSEIRAHLERSGVLEAR
jgi:pimeloyl-ACP methyl ester carboxylesterase